MGKHTKRFYMCLKNFIAQAIPFNLFKTIFKVFIKLKILTCMIQDNVEIFLFKKDLFLFIYSTERGWGRETERNIELFHLFMHSLVDSILKYSFIFTKREKNTDVREKHQSVASCRCLGGANPQARHVT